MNHLLKSTLLTMTETSRSNDKSKKATYTFRFSTSNKCLRLNQKQLDHIPYLSTLVAHDDDFISIRNENDEYVLDSSIHYNCIISILLSIRSKQPYTLFTELPEHDNMLVTLQLFDYLGVNPFPSPLLRGQQLVLLNSTNNNINEELCAKYHHATVSEARNTAAEFIIALSKNEYDLRDFDTMDRIFSLVTNILSSAEIYSSRFRHHTLAIVKQCCFTFFTKNRQSQLINTHQTTQKNKNFNSFMYIFDDNSSVPNNYYGTFSWKGVYKTTEENFTSVSSTSFRSIICFERFPFWYYFFRQLEADLKKQKKELRSRHINTSLKRPKFDKFKHQSGPKAQKYR
jgi:hypothetical protein